MKPGVVLIFCLCLAGVLMLPSRDWIWVSPDSVNYMSIAANLLRGNGPVNSLGYVEISHPFGYSLALLPFMAVGIGWQEAAIAVSWLSLAAVGFLAWLLVSRLTGSRTWRELLAGGLAMAGPAQVEFANKALSETLAAALSLLFVWLCLKVGECEK